VEHGGIFMDALPGLPGGIGQIIWNAVGDRICSFLGEQDSRGAVARSIIGYCDGKRVRTYTGETRGQITKSARGGYKFNWDPIFIPDGSDLTYGEMGPEKKQATSQSLKAWKAFLKAEFNSQLP
jgi:XTP/dITP diphosphohydrolase